MYASIDVQPCHHKASIDEHGTLGVFCALLGENLSQL